MAVREGLLALLEGRPSHGYQLKTAFEAATGGTWPLNVGQVYTTLDRLQRDGLVTSDEADGQKRYAITPAGRQELGGWWSAVPGAAPPPRDELLLKVLLAVEEGAEHALDVITRHRTALTQLLQARRRATRPGTQVDLASALVSDALVARAEADLRWLDACEARILRARTQASRPPRTETSMAELTSPIPALELQAVVKRYGAGRTEVRALTDVSLCIAPGELVAVMGPSGCGKSTLLHLAGALEDPDAGHILVGGRDLSTMSTSHRAALRRTDVGFVFQRLNLVPSLSALENVMLPLELEGVGARDARQRARDALVSVGITEQLDRFPDDFSGGQQQRIAVARAVVGSRRLILADEPTGALDTMTGDAVIELIAELPRTTGAAVVLVTHEPRYAAWADRVVFMRDGRIVDEASVAPSTFPSASPAGVSR